MPEPSDAARRHRAEARSEGDFEAFSSDLVDEIARAADIDAERSAEPLPRFGYDVLVDPTAGSFAHWLDRDDRAVIGNLEIGHCGVFHQTERHDASTPARTWNAGMRPSSNRLIEEGSVSAARRPRSMSNRLSASSSD
jgi:hypothetical protein